MNTQNETCECHECTQARYRSSFIGQLDAALRIPTVVNGSQVEIVPEKGRDSGPKEGE